MLNYRFFTLFMLIGLVFLIPHNTLAAHKIAVITLHQPIAGANNPLQENTGYATRKGVLDAFGLTYQENVNQYPLDNGYTIELHTYNRENGETNPLIALSNDPDVAAIICNSSNDCLPALDEKAAKDILITAISATTTTFGGQENILRMSPSNALMAEAIYRRMKGDGVTRFAIVYEMAVYTMDYYTQLTSSYFIDLITSSKKMTFVGAFPITDYAGLSDMQKGTTADHIVPMLSKLNIDGVVYIGYANSFNALVNHPDSHLLNDKKWYADDALHPVIKGFPNLQVLYLYRPKQEDIHTYYYYGVDAGSFMKKIVDSYEGVLPQQRSELIAKAKLTALDDTETQTGAKTFKRADQFGYFNMQHFDEVGLPLYIEKTSVSKY